MGLSSLEIIKAICPELSGSPSLQVYLDMAVESTSTSFFGTMYHHAVAYKAAHLFTLLDDSKAGATGELGALGGGAPIASVSEGGVSVSFAQNAATDVSVLNSTNYGKTLLGIMKGRPRLGVNQAGGLV